jgi:hypothetical protein
MARSRRTPARRGVSMSWPVVSRCCVAGNTFACCRFAHVDQIAPVTRVPAALLARLWRGRDVAIVYTGILLASAAILGVVPAQVARAWMLASSTNLDNLRHHPPLVLAMSPFVQPLQTVVVLAPLLLWAYGAAQR